MSHDNGNNSSSDHSRTFTPISPGIATVASTYVIILILIVTLNTMALRSLYKSRAEHSTPFRVYIGHLFVTNICASLLDIPLDIYAMFHDNHLSFSQCAFYTFINWVFFAVVINSHLLITVNRLWAVVHPFSYRKIYTFRFATFSCCITWIYVLLWVLPIYSYKMFITADDKGCLLDIMDKPEQSISVSVWQTVTYVAVFLCPVVIIIFLYPFIEFKRRQMVFLRQRVAQVVDANAAGDVVKRYRPRRANDPRTFRVLMALTGSLLLSWMPQLIWELVQNQAAVMLDSGVYVLIDSILDVSWTAQAVLDPVLFIFVFRARI